MKKQITINPVNKDPQQKQRRPPLKYTKLFLTFNTNIVYQGSGSQEKLDNFTNGMKAVFENIEDYIVFVSGEPEWSKIESIKATVSPEIGPKRKMVHGHALVIIIHRAKIRLNYQKIKEDLIDMGAVPASGFHFYSKLIKDNLQNVEDYINKHRGELVEEGPEKFQNKKIKLETPAEEE